MKKCFLFLIFSLYIVSVYGKATLYNSLYYDEWPYHPGYLQVVSNQNGTQENYASGYITIASSIDYPQYPVIAIAERAFQGCINLRTISLPSTIRSIGSWAFSRCNSLYKINIPSNVMTISEGSFSGCTSLENIELPNSITKIEDSAFSSSGLTSIEIPSSVKSIGAFAFDNCENLRRVVIPNSIDKIDTHVFSNCHLTNVELPNSITEIGLNAFRDNDYLQSIILPSSLKIIGNNAFCGNGSLHSIYCYALEPPEAVEPEPGYVGSFEFYTYERATLYVPAESLEKYRSTLPWSHFYNIKAYDAVEAEDITLFPSDATINIGDSFKLTATVLPENTTDKTIFWKSENKNVASVASDGTVTGVSVGVANITATCGDVSATCKVTVNPVPANRIELNVSDMTLRVGQTDKLIATVSPDNTTDKSVTWTSDSPEIASISSDGTVTGISIGIANITATCGDVSVTCKVTVYPVPANRIELNVSDMTLLIGQTDKLIATVSPDNTTDKSVTWTSDRPEIASISSDGTVTGVSVGVANITATCGDVSATCKVTVNPVPANRIELNVSDMTLRVGERDKLMVTVSPDNAADKTITWTSDNPAIATVAPDGTVTGVSVGVTLITATCGEVSASCKVTVNPVPVSTVELNVSDMTILVGQRDKLTATVSPDNAADKTITWTSDNPAIATVDPDGTVTGVSVGVTLITATCGEVSASCKVRVNPVEITSIELSLENVTMLIGTTTTLTAKVYPENVTNPVIIWSSANPSIASVNGSGIITANQEGETRITASCGEITATCKVTVTPVTPSSIDLNVKDMVLYIGQSETIQAIVRPANTTYPTVSWQSDDETVATVSSNGMVTGLKEGTVIITATCGNVSAICAVTVKPIPASNIEITSGNVTLTMGNCTTLTAKVSPENTTYPDISWSSSDANIATITDEGKVTAVSIGTAIITAKCDNVSATCTVTVIPVPSEGIVISPSEVEMLLGDTFALSAIVYPETTTDKSVTWGSDNPAVASVSSSGVVTALNLGSATITASNGTSKAICKITVNPVVATGISLNIMDETLFVASSTQLVATISPYNVTDKTITWTSSKPEIATVSDQGEVVGVAVGTTTVTATIGTVSASAQINVVHRLPDMDPSVTTSERDIVTIAGRPVNMAVFAVGGEPNGWTYLWTKNGETVSKSSELNITAINETNTVKAETYRVKVENEIDKVVILSEVFDFVVQIYPAVNENPDGNGIDLTVTTGTDSTNKTREGNIIILSAETPDGGYPQGWEFIWSEAQGEIGEGETVETIATMTAGSSKEIENTTYNLDLTNYGPEGDVWAQFKLKSNPIAVYRRPQTPQQMLRKGNGTSHTFVAMMSLSDLELDQLDYEFIYGWTDADGNDHIIEQTNERYCHTDAEIYNDPTNSFWVYSIWIYKDGCMVSSGLRYLDGNADENFDASVFDGSFARVDKKTQSRIAIYSIDGHYMGSDVTRLVPGIYIHTITEHGMVKTEKIIIR